MRASFEECLLLSLSTERQIILQNLMPSTWQVPLSAGGGAQDLLSQITQFGPYQTDAMLCSAAAAN